MTAVDTNILVRFLVKDDKTQYESASAVFRSGDIFIPRTVILETEWVLRYVYEFEPLRILEAFRSLFGLHNVHTEDFHIVADAISLSESGLDFADAMHIASSKGADKFMSFDKSLVRKASKLANMKVDTP